MNNKLLTVIYSHPEAYPPTLNALTELAKVYDKISVLFRPTLSAEWPYPENVNLFPSGTAMTSREQEKLPLYKRMYLFLNFCFQFVTLCKNEKPNVVLLYDPLALLAYRVALLFGLKEQYVWYHNHDVLEGDLKKYSLNWWAAKAERKLFSGINIFSLPSKERKTYFPMGDFHGKFFFIPNQPAVSFYGQFHGIEKSNKYWRIIFQGHIDKGHGIEELMDLMPFKIDNRPVQLILKGWVREDYRKVLENKIKEKSLENAVEFVGYTAYQELPKLTASCHIGIAIHTKSDIMNSTLGTASNKIYEYAAVGLPILYFDNEHFRQHLNKYEWAVSTDLSSDSLKNAIRNIAANFEDLSELAKNDFKRELNFENKFSEVTDYLKRAKVEVAKKLAAVA